MKYIKQVLREQYTNFYLIRRLSIYELRSRNKNNYLGMAWEFINPLIQILIYWFVFGAIRKRTPISLTTGEEVEFIFWLIAAFVLWTYFYQSLIQGSKSIYSRLRMLSKMNFPLSVIPSIVIYSQLYIHIILLGVIILILNFSGYLINIYYLQLIYFIFATTILVFSITLITSTLSTMLRDVHMFLNATLRMFLYLSPILWPIASIIEQDWVINILKLNPLYYLIEGYRSALFGTEWYITNHLGYTIYFWLFLITVLYIGSKIHIKFRRHFIDYL